MILPEIGVGIIYFPGLYFLLEMAQDTIDAIEVEPQTFWYKSRSQDSGYRLNQDVIQQLSQFKQPKIVHGVGFPIGGTTPLDLSYLPTFKETITAVNAPWCSEHLSFNRFTSERDEFNTGFLCPPLQTLEGVKKAAANIRELKAKLPIPFAFETGVNYLQPLEGELSDGQFFAAVAEEADCGIVLDLHNLWCNEQNGRQPLREVLAELPLERVWEVHLAGGQDYRGYWLDAHSDFVPVPLMELAKEIIPTLPNLKALIFEILEDFVKIKGIQPEALLDQVRQLRSLWDLRGSRVSTAISSPSSPLNSPSLETTNRLPSAAEWETALGESIALRPMTQPFGKDLNCDPGTQVFQHLVASQRGGMIVTSLRLSTRLLTLSLGEPQFQELLETFWKTTPPERFASDEASNWATYLQTLSLSVPFLEDVLRFELASHQVLSEGTPQRVKFSSDPFPILSALQLGHLPPPTSTGECEFLVQI
jgi:uncharacterized protein